MKKSPDVENTFQTLSPSTPIIPISRIPTVIPSSNTFLVILLVIASFLLGMLYTKVQYLEKGNTNVLGAAAAPVGQGGSGNTLPMPTPEKVKPVTTTDHIRGNTNAKVAVIEYSDFECPFCKRFHPVMQEVMQTYGDKIRWVFRHYPLSFHANAQKEHEASECIAELGGNEKFWAFHDAIFERTTSNGTGFALDKLGPLAQELGVDQTQFQNCLDSGKFTRYVQDQLTEGSRAGVSGTPSSFIVDSQGNSQIIVGAQPVETVKAAIDAALTR